MKRKVLTLHIDGLRLTPELVVIMSSVSAQLESPDVKLTKEGMVVYDDDWNRHI